MTAEQEGPLVEATDEDIIRELLARRHYALTHNDRELMAEMLHPRYFYISAHGQSYNKAQFLEEYFDQGPHIVPSWTIREVTIEEGVASASSYVGGNFNVGGRRYSGAYTVSHTLVKIDGKWIFLSGHMNS